MCDWKSEALALAAHLDHLLKRCWKAQFTVSLPRLRPCAGEFTPRHSLPDREFVQLTAALRICFPHVGIVLSTREPAALRDALLPLGITMMSAGSHTEPGGYTGEGKNDLHRTVRGRREELAPQPADAGGCNHDQSATQQFEIADTRSAAEIAGLLQSRGFEAVWKDWDQAIAAK